MAAVNSHVFDVEDAINHGVSKAILLWNIRYWVAHNKSNGINQHNGRTWTYNTSDSYAILFPYFTSRSISRWLKELVDDGYLIAGNYNKIPYDRTIWYALPDESNIRSGICQETTSDDPSANSGKSIRQSGGPIPDVNTNINTDINNNINNKNFLSIEEIKSPDFDYSNSKAYAYAPDTDLQYLTGLYEKLINREPLSPEEMELGNKTFKTGRYGDMICPDDKRNWKRFERFFMNYPGHKNGACIEGGKKGMLGAFDLLTTHADWRDVCSYINDALKDQIEQEDYRKSIRAFVPQWPHIKTWLTERRWEEKCQFPSAPSPHHRRPYQERLAEKI